ncbi:putative nuclease HARBI1 [Rhizophagus clarus]|uniref:Putative nuclease HARBI1 n=1 Tax=Rhizophagus clarus TaxID=94130 RepID=A0A8H3QEJ3_9GLOM|nr:putative nuclease HARBI1 [Rhizophagus clarus]
MEEEEDFMDLNDDDDIEEIFTFGLLILNKIRYIEPRVYNVLVLMSDRYVKLPTDQARKFIHEGFKAIGCIEDIIGIIDGTHLILQNAPQKDKEVYFTRKKRYALHWQGIVDFRGIFISYDVGWPGSVHDARVYRHSSFYSNRSFLIKENDFLIGDSAYPLSPFLIKPNNKPNNA